MTNKIINKYVMVFFVFLLLFAVGIKVHAVLSTPKISDWNFHQLQKIDKNKTSFSFVVFGDNKNSITTFNHLISRLNKEDILFAIDDGDLVFDGENEKFEFFLNQIHNLNKPLLTVFGNHEARENGRAVYYNLFGPFYYSFVVGDSYFIVLDDANEKNLDDAQFAWLKNELKTSQNYKYRFVFMHVPIYDPRNGSEITYYGLKDKDFAKKLNDLFDENNITMLFVSHIHGYFRGVWGKTPYTVTGGAGAELMGTNPKHYFYHYIKVDVTQSGVKYNVIKLKNPDFELLDRWAHDVWIYIYAFFAIHFSSIILFISLSYLIVYILITRWDSIIRRINR